MRNLNFPQRGKTMDTLHRKSVFAVIGASIFALSLIAVNPAHARSGSGNASPTLKFMMKNGAKLSVNTQQEAKERLRQLATDPAVTSDSREPGVWKYDLPPNGTGIVRRRTLPQ